MKAEVSLPSSQKPAMGPYLEPVKSSPHPFTQLFSGSVQYYPVISAYVFKAVSHLKFSSQNSVRISHLSMRRTYAS